MHIRLVRIAPDAFTLVLRGKRTGAASRFKMLRVFKPGLSFCLERFL